jgi:hypothetical protein
MLLMSRHGRNPEENLENFPQHSADDYAKHNLMTAKNQLFSERIMNIIQLYLVMFRYVMFVHILF